VHDQLHPLSPEGVAVSQCRRAVVAGVALAAMVLGGCATSHHGPDAPAGAAATSTTKTSSAPAGVTAPTTRVFTPYGRGGAPTAGVVEHRSGSCFTQSITVAARGAYRCFAANTILDPCFAKPGTKHLLDCYPSPWSRAVQLHVDTLPTAATAVHVTRPWAIELAGGQHCVVTNGTAPTIRGVSLGYLCTDGDAGLRRDPAGGAMSALYRATDGAITTRAVDVVWHAAAGTG
jgi:hypothetical protein